jgi:PAS domain S-box-containing protein
MSEHLSTILIVIEILIGLGTIIGVLYGGLVWIIRPIRKLATQTSQNITYNQRIVHDLDKRIIPFIDSMTHEFNPNSGKSIKDQLNRIDDSIRLGELRSKMISNSLVTTGTYECNADGEVTWVNNAMADLFGMSKDEMLGRGWLTGVKAGERHRVWDEWMETVDQDIPYEAEYTVVNQKTRNETPIRTVAVAHKNLDSQILGYYGTMFGI